ncbi:MAG TPA: hypothetical protein VIG57_10305 [Candidatus Entotheonella sp.]
MYQAEASWGPAEPEAIGQGIIKVRTHPDFTPVLAKYSFLGHLANGDEFDFRLVLMSNDNVFALFCQADQFEKTSFCLFHSHNF